MKFEQLKARLIESMIAFLKKESELLIQDVNEEAITSVLTKYIENQFLDWKWHIDHQYDKRFINNELVNKRIILTIDSIPKSKLPKKIPTNSKKLNKMIRPDIIIHDRQSNEHNFVVIEIKLSTNRSKVDRDFDILKLKTMTETDLKYEWGVFIDLKTGKEFNENNPFDIEFFKDGSRKLDN